MIINKTKKIIFLIIGLVLSISIIASAATLDQWGPNWYTPYDALVSVQSDMIYADFMEWNSSQISQYHPHYCWELEFRPTGGNNPDDYWDGVDDFLTNLPAGYYEYEEGQGSDDNDITIGSHSVENASSSIDYYGFLYLNEKSSTPSGIVIESELGDDLGLIFDGLPLRYEYFKTNAQQGVYYSW